MKALNERGYRTKAYTSQREKRHHGKPFTTSSVQYLLKNPAYAGKKVIKAKRDQQGEAPGGHRLVAAVWPGIIDEEKFERAQRLMAANSRSNHNGARAVRHSYVLSGGLLQCGRCSSPMEGRSGTGRLGVKYFYYACRARECGLRVSAGEIEGAVIARIQQLATEDGLLGRLVEETNKRLARQRPALLTRRRSLQKGLEGVKGGADKVLAEWPALEAEAGRAFLMEKLSELAQRRSDLERGVAEADESLAQLDREQVTSETVRNALGRFGEVYACLTPSSGRSWSGWS